MSAAIAADRRSVLREIRDEAAERVLQVLLWGAGLLLASSAVRALGTGWNWIYSFHVAIYAFALLAYGVRRRVSPRVTIGVFLGAGYLGSVQGMLSYGMTSGLSFPLQCTMCALAALLYGARTGAIAVLLTTMVIAAVGSATVSGAWRSPIDLDAQFALAFNWTAAVGAFVALAFIVLWVVGILTERLRAGYGAAREAARELETELAERARVDRELRRSRARFAGALQASPDATAVILAAGARVLFCNAPFARLAGVAEEDCVGLTLRELGLPDGLARGADLRLRVEGAERRYQGSAASFAAGGQANVLLVVRDVTEELADDAELRHLTDELEQAVRERTEEIERTAAEAERFSYSVAHDLRAPLRAINASSRLLEDECAAELTPAQVDLARRIGATALRLGGMIDAMLELARLNRQALRREAVDVSGLAREVLQELRSLEPAREVETVLAEGLSAQADRELLRSVLRNLLDNAWKFTARTSGARVELGGSGEEFWVRDNGAGFDARYAEKLFRPFQRLHSPEEFAGTGIGLATAARIVERHGGRVWAEGAPGAGATVHFTLPAPAAA